MKIRKLLLGPAAVLAGCFLMAGPTWAQADKPSDRVLEGAKPGTASNPGTPNPDRIKKAQQALKDQGYYSGPVDGVFSESTHDAVRSLQRSKKLNVTGNIDDQTARELGLEQ
jgi:peptidoglycan hydrolase-like protein with peptidoglycan-binding domain